MYLILVVLIVVAAASLFFAGPFSNLRGKFTGVVTRDVILEKGYNLVSVPYSGFTASTDCTIVAIYHFNSATQDYDPVASINELKPGYGYFIKHRPPSTASVTTCKITFTADGGTGLSTSSLGDSSNSVLNKGYNMLGGTFESINVADIKGDCNIVAIYGGFDSINRDYVPIDLTTGQLDPYKAYFVKHRVASTSTITTCTLTAGKGGEITQSNDNGGTSSTTTEVNTVDGTDTQVPQAIPDDTSIEPTPPLPV